ncbi:MAG: ATP-binding cassette domain-containing protein [Acidaminobacter sp.]|uniref:ABC transporter ATP-binding protein n=1 Tax=Acidaminobacter sp. TaxID=1872102 RepID=UPI00137EFE11|nr:ABC transporter ATP-binding protein [Acidaminobacter sp.]MZQ96097.1 ATP-binding cassette domain-containing protein [Acidaminobacter sp.]
MIQAEALSKKKGGTVILNEFSLEIKTGRVTALLGPSGSGKTTLLRLLGGIDLPDQGVLRGLPETGPAFVFQDHRVIPWLNVEENVAFALPEDWTAEQREQAIDESLTLTRLTSLRRRLPNALSGGQASRIDLARALATGRRLMLLDEPFKGLDLELKLELMEDFGIIMSQSEVTAVLVTHDLDEALLTADTVVVVSGPPLRIVEVLEVPLAKVGRSMFDPALNALRQRLYRLLVSEK